MSLTCARSAVLFGIGQNLEMLQASGIDQLSYVHGTSQAGMTL